MNKRIRRNITLENEKNEKLKNHEDKGGKEMQK
jgi:hypothetical protein